MQGHGDASTQILHTYTPHTQIHAHIYTHLPRRSGLHPALRCVRGHPSTRGPRPTLLSFAAARPLEHRPHEFLAPPCWGGACALRPISSAGGVAGSAGKMADTGSSVAKRPKVSQVGCGPWVQPATLRGARGVPWARL